MAQSVLGKGVLSRLDHSYSMRQPTSDELRTCQSLLEREPSARMVLMPTHHVDEFGDLTGFRFTCSGSASGASLPVSRCMFFGHTAGEFDVFDLVIWVSS